MTTPTPQQKKKRTSYRFTPKKHMLQFTCRYGVFPYSGQTSVCYVTDMKRARLISIALNRFMNSEEGILWIKNNM